MKKLFAVLVGLIFLGSVVGIAAVTAKCNLPDVTTVKVGGTFTVGWPCEICDEGYLQVVSNIDGYVTYRALKPGKVTFCNDCEGQTYCATVTITPKSSPMKEFMKILGLGQKD